MKAARYLITILLFSLSVQFNVMGQDRIIISAGIGAPELVNAGARYNFRQLQAGLTIGALPIFSYFTGSASAELYYHFGGSSGLTTLHPWYTKMGLTYLKDEDDNTRDKYLYGNLQIGRDINFSAKAGMEIYAGLSFQLYHDRHIKMEQPPGAVEYSEDYVMPSLGICFFFRI
jgi:hypothetical protein